MAASWFGRWKLKQTNGTGKTMSSSIIIIGAGGVGSWLLPALVKLHKTEPEVLIEIWDGDILEEGNMDRQLFDPESIGRNKASALAKRYKEEVDCKLVAKQRYYTTGESAFDNPNTWLFGCADNHPARREILQTCDDLGTVCIIGGNGYDDADAYYYDSAWKDTPCDPRVYYPDILTDTTGSPVHAAGCTGEAQVETPQLVLANYWAAAHMMHLYWYHTTKKPTLDKQFYEHIPMLSRNSAYMFETLTVGILEKQHERKLTA